jgi:acetoin utilization deacetylase AcuC-like enzyme
LEVTTQGIRHIVRDILQTANVPFVFFLEGGYHVEALGENVKVTIEEMLK